VDGERIYLHMENAINIIGWNRESVRENDRGIEDMYTLYPTPAVYGEKVELSRELAREVTLYDISGRLRKILRHGTCEIDARGLSPGVYFLMMISE